MPTRTNGLIRVIQRDVVERGRTAEAVMERYTRVLKPMHQQFIEPCKSYARFDCTRRRQAINVAIDILTMYIKKHIEVGHDSPASPYCLYSLHHPLFCVLACRTQTRSTDRGSPLHTIWHRSKTAESSSY